MEKEMVSTFMEITSCESQAHAVQHLGSCRWNLDEAINLYFSGAGAGPSGVSASITSEEEVVMKEEEEYYDVGAGGDNGDDDVRAPIPARVEALYEEDAYYGNRSTAHDAPFIGEAPYPAPAPAVHVQALSEIEATGWGDAESIEATGLGDAGPGEGGEVGVVNGDQAHDDAAQEDNRSSEDGRMGSGNEEDNEQSDNMSYSMSYSYNETSDYGLQMDEEDAYYASIADDGTEEGGEQPRPTQPEQANSLDELYQLPMDLMYNASFHDSKVRAAREDRFLLVNLQTFGAAGDFQSELHNRDLWAVEQVKDVVKGSFVFLLLQKRDNYIYLDECAKVSSFYRLEDDELPAVLVLDPITGKLLAKWSGPMTPDEFMRYIDEYTELKPSTLPKLEFVKKTSASAVAGGEQEPASSPAAATVEQEPAAPEISAAAAAAVEQEPAAPEISAPAAEAGEKEPEIPDNSAPAGACIEEEPVPVPETESLAEMADDDEPMEGETMYKLRIRLPDGTVVAKEFGCKRRFASLFAFCRSAVRGGGEAEQKAFRIMRFAGGAFQAMQDDGAATFEDMRLNCAAVSVVFDT